MGPLVDGIIQVGIPEGAFDCGTTGAFDGGTTGAFDGGTTGAFVWTVAVARVGAKDGAHVYMGFGVGGCLV